MKVGVALTDILTGLYASTAILAALQWRERSGLGQHIDLALLDVQVACLANQSMNHLYGEKVPGRLGNGHPNAVPYQDFPTANGRMILAIGNDAQFARFCKVAGSPEWVTDKRFASNASRVKHRAELIALMSAATAQRSTACWMEQLEAAGVPCGPINTIKDVFEDVQVNARGMKLTMHHPSVGDIPLVASPLRLSDTPVRYAKAPPPLGFDTRNVLAELLDLSSTQLEALTRDGVIA
jgi:crotonobetainyl-CoA:carnitine CoA-transferase CaiB-like acyl-CoA transferase